MDRRPSPYIEGTLRLDEPIGTWDEYQHGAAGFGSARVIIARVSQLGVPGFCILVDPAQAASLQDALFGSGAAAVGTDAMEAARIEAGYPLFGVDMTEDTIPLEAGIEDRAISFTKGCYVGQEVIIRVLHRGHGRVARKLVGAPSGRRRARLVERRSWRRRREVGWVTSAARVAATLARSRWATCSATSRRPEHAVSVEATAGRA